MEEAPAVIPSDGIIVENELVIRNDNAYDNASIYVKPSGKLVVESDIAKIASITVLEGGQMYFSGKGIDGVKLLSYGDLYITSDEQPAIAKANTGKNNNPFLIILLTEYDNYFNISMGFVFLAIVENREV